MNMFHHYNQWQSRLTSSAPSVLNAIRTEAVNSLESLGLPTSKTERYRYTDIAQLLDGFADADIAIEQLELPSHPYLFSMRRAAEVMPKVLEQHYAQIANIGEDALVALNTMLTTDGIVIYVPRNTKAEKPIYITDNLVEVNGARILPRRLLVVLEQGAEATVFVGYSAAKQSTPLLSTQVMEVSVGDNAHLNLYEMEDTQDNTTRLAHTAIRCGRDAVVRHFGITLNCGTTRNTIDARLCDTGSELSLNGLAIADARQHIDVNTLIDHAAPGCASHELYKFIVDDEAVGAFAGKILVEKDAQKTTSDEVNANICASTKARMFTQPMLEIYADDVKCSHGSTVGVLDPSALFYMQQRGISEPEARRLLKFAFIAQVIDLIDLEPLNLRLHQYVRQRLA